MWKREEKKEEKGINEEEKIDTVLGITAEIKGNIIVKGSIKIDGKLEGEIFAEQTVTIGSKGIVKGDINANNISCKGIIYGNTVCKNKLELSQSGQLYGDITTNALIISEGAIFEGNCIMKKQEDITEQSEENKLFSVQEEL